MEELIQELNALQATLRHTIDANDRQEIQTRVQRVEELIDMHVERLEIERQNPNLEAALELILAWNQLPRQ